MGISNLSTGLRPGVCTSTTRPSTPFEGQMIYETDTNRVLVYEGAAWVMIADTDTPPGLELIKSQSVGTTAVASVVVSSVFSSSYDNYRIVLNGIEANTSDSFMIRFGSGATTGHYSSMYYDRFDGAVTGTVRTNNTGKIYLCLNEANAQSVACSIDVASPNLAQQTQVFGTYNGRGYAGWSGGFNNTSTRFTGFEIHTDGSGTMTKGTIRVYGYRNS